MTGGRVALWDNAKLLVLVLVVVGHVIEQVKDVGYGPWALFAFLYIFHIPTIFLVAGVFARTQVDRKTVAAVAQLVVAYVAWEFINAGVRYLVEGETIRPGFLVNPSMALWFLLALATMRIVLPFLDMLRHPLLVSVAIALGAVLLPDVGTAFSAARTCAFLPFFVAGHVLARRGVFQDPRFREPSRLSRGAALGLLACGLLALVAVPRLWTGWDLTDWLFRKTSVT
ncbi:MAG: acyltransferase family protein, partial [Marmoricola sp.]